jgi:hypothetical protein
MLDDISVTEFIRVLNEGADEDDAEWFEFVCEQLAKVEAE